LLLRSGATTLLLLVFCGACFGQAPIDDRCSVNSFKADAARTAEDCASILAGDDLADAARAEALKIQARSLHATGRLDDAIRNYELALRLKPNDPELHLRRGWTAFDKRDFETLFGQARQALELKPDYAEAYGLVGIALGLREIGRPAEAKAAFNEAVRLDPNDPGIRYNFFAPLAVWGPWEEALKAADEVLRLPTAAITQPGRVDYYRMKTSFRTMVELERGLILGRLGRIDEAENAYDKAVQDDPCALTFAWRSRFHLEHSAPHDVVQTDLDRSLALDSSYWLSLELAARVHFYDENYQSAAAEFARAIELFPINGTMRWWHAMTLRKLGRLEDASAEAVTAFRVDSGFMREKAPALRQHGYLLAQTPGVDPRPALYDAALACMLDEGCW
jgi:tetratricopeptide (TPR) repeat protein